MLSTTRPLALATSPTDPEAGRFDWRIRNWLRSSRLTNQIERAAAGGRVATNTGLRHEPDGRLPPRHQRGRGRVRPTFAERWEVRRLFAVSLARLTMRTLVSASLLTAVGRACCNQIVDVIPWLRSSAFTFRNARHEADKEHEGCPTAAPGPVRWAALALKNVRARRRHRDLEGSASAAVVGDRCAVVLPDWTRPQLVCGDQPAMARWRLVSRPVRVPGRSERCSSALEADPWLRRACSVATRSTSGCRRVERRRCAPGPLAEQAPCRGSCLPHGRPSPWRTSQVAWAAPLVGDPGAGQARAPTGAAPAARAVQPWRERVPTGARAGVRPADRPRSGLGSCRTRRPVPARSGRRTQTAAIHDPSGRHRSAARRFLSRSGLRYAMALSLTIERRSRRRSGLRTSAGGYVSDP